MAFSLRSRGSLHAHWRTVDIVVVAVVAALFGVVYWAWGLVSFASVFSAFPPVAAVTNVVFVMAGPLGALIVRRPGAALAAELLAALFEAMVSVSWSGTSIVVYGVVEGAAAEAAFALARYRNWGLRAALASGLFAGAAMALLDVWIYRYYAYFPVDQKLSYLALAAVAGAVIAGGVSWYLVRALAATGVLAPFTSGREQNLV
jgi:energy-coupling factor transport system substrate-specific component